MIPPNGNKGDGLMYTNLEAGIERLCLTNKDCSNICGISKKTFSNKKAVKTEFVLSEMKALQNFFPTVLYNICSRKMTAKKDVSRWKKETHLVTMKTDGF